MRLSYLTLMSGNDIPFPEAQLIIHQPTIKEIGYIGEGRFYMGCGLLSFSKDMLNLKGNFNLEQYNDFDILMTMILKADNAVKDSIKAGLDLLSLMFPLYTIEVRNNCIAFLKEGEPEHYLNAENFSVFKQILEEMFKLDFNKLKKLNPNGDLAKRIAEKLQERHKHLNQLKGQDSNNDTIILAHYSSILAIGMSLNLNDIMNYTVYQLFDQFQRWQYKLQWDINLKARLAGAKNTGKVEDWMMELYNKSAFSEKKKK